MGAFLAFLADQRDMFLLLLGFILGLGPTWWASRRKAIAHWEALRAEMTYCRSSAQVYFRAGIPSPLYRLPTKAYEAALPALLADGEVMEQEVTALLLFYSQIETINRGLDDASEAYKSKDEELLRQAWERNRIKCAVLVPGASEDSQRYLAAIEAVEKHLKKSYRLVRFLTVGRRT